MDKVEKKKLLEECQNYHYSQSSKASSLSRTIIYGIIGTCWILIYADNEFHEPCILLEIALASSFIYLLLDLIHYFTDSCSYRKEYFRLNDDLTADRHEKYMDKVSKRSFYILIMKFGLAIVIAVIFIIGTLRQLEVIKMS